MQRAQINRDRDDLFKAIMTFGDMRGAAHAARIRTTWSVARYSQGGGVLEIKMKNPFGFGSPRTSIRQGGCKMTCAPKNTRARGANSSSLWTALRPRVGAAALILMSRVFRRPADRSRPMRRTACRDVRGMTTALVPRTIPVNRPLRRPCRGSRPYSYLIRRMLDAALFTPVAILAATCPAVAANLEVAEARVIANFAITQSIVLCYDRIPEFIYVINREVGAALQSMVFDGTSHQIATFPRPLDQSSLSCSDDASTIAVMDSKFQYLYVIQNGLMSEYEVVEPASRALATYSTPGLLGESGDAIALPQRVVHVSGPDPLQRMHPFITESGEVFISGKRLYVWQRGNYFIDVYDGGSPEWEKRLRMQIPSTTNFVAAVARCGNHDVATLTEYDDYKFYDLTAGRIRPVDWLSKIGIKGRFRNLRLGELGIHSGSFGRCVFPVSDERRVPNELKAFAVIGSSGLSVFKIKGPPLVNIIDRVSLTKDGCFGLFQASTKLGEDALRRSVYLAKFSSTQCNTTTEK
jgi:hypothetical protein